MISLPLTTYPTSYRPTDAIITDPQQDSISKTCYLKNIPFTEYKNVGKLWTVWSIWAGWIITFVFITNINHIRGGIKLCLFSEFYALMVYSSPDILKLLSTYRRFYRLDIVFFSPQQHFELKDQIFFPFISRLSLTKPVMYMKTKFTIKKALSQSIAKSRIPQRLHHCHFQ